MRDDPVVRTTLDLDDDVLQAAKEIASTRGSTAGKVLSELARKALCPPRNYDVRNGVPVIHRPPGTPLMTTADVKRLQEDEDER